LSTDYISWSDTMIVVKVPTQAGTGTIQVENSDPSSTLSSDTLTVPYNLINVTYLGTHYGTRLQGLNPGASNIFTFNTRFFDSTNAKEDFVTALEAWRCKSLVNFDTTNTTTANATRAYDSINLVSWDFTDTLPLGVLGQATSTFLGCNGGADWFVRDIDIFFNNIPFTGYTWEYGAGVPSGTQFDFESVAVHEMGHAHLLGHVVDSIKVMHYSVSNGQKKSSISTLDSFGAIDIMNKSISSICGQPVMTRLSSTTCSFTPLPVDFIELVASNRNKEIVLDWFTINEQNVERFSVQRLLLSNNTFIEIASIASNSQSSFYSEYQFIDAEHDAINEHMCYRILSIDYNNSQTQSNIECIELTDSRENFMIQDANSTYTIRYNGYQIQKDELKFYNQLGQDIHFEINGDQIKLINASAGLIIAVFERGTLLKTQRLLHVN
jgi:hypothetical protein